MGACRTQTRSRAEIRLRRSAVESIRHDVVVSVGRIAWLTTVAVFVIAAICLFFSDYTGYAVLSLAVAASAAVNLR